MARCKNRKRTTTSTAKQREKMSKQKSAAQMASERMKITKFAIYVLCCVLLSASVMGRYSKYHPVEWLSIDCLLAVKWWVIAIWLALLASRPWSSDD